MVLLLPPFHFGWLVWVVFAPVLLFLWSLGERKRFRKAFLVGLFAGSVGFLGLFSWLQTVTVLGWAVVSVYLALFPAFWAAIVATLADPRREPEGNSWSGSVRRAFWVASLWCGFEWLRGWLFTGFGWNGIGVAFHQTPIFAQSADLFGIVGLSFLPVFVQTVVVQVVLRLFSKGPAVARRQPHYDLAVAICLVAASFSYGRWRISSAGKGESMRLKTLMVQLDIKQEQTKRLADPLQIPIDYEAETIGALQSVPAERKPDWVILPESALDGRILRMPDETWGMANENFETLHQIGEEGSFTTIMGLVEVEGEKFNDQIAIKKNSRYWNSMAVFARDGSLQTFKKHHLVIFGEWIPFVEEIPLLKKIYEEQSGEEFNGSFSRGESLEPLSAQVGGNDVQIIPTVCFEDSVGRLVRKFTRDAPQVIVNVTNDGWFKESIGAEQHFANARFRAIELRRPLVRCANSGVTAAVDTLGMTRNPDTGKPQELRDEDGKTFFRGHLFADIDIPKHPQWTLYSVIGDWGVIGAAVLSLLWAMLVARRNRPVPADPYLPSFG